MRVRRPDLFSALVLSTVLTVPSAAQTDPPTYTPTPLFASHEALRLRLAFDWRKVTRDIDPDDRDEHDAILTLRDEPGTEPFEIELRTRGHFRRERSNCNFPPLRVDFKQKAVAGSVFEGQDKLKLVTHCQDGREEYEQYILLEYLVYRTLNLLTDKSYRARLVEMTYVDTDERRDSLTRSAILIESDEELVARLGGMVIEIEGVHPNETDADYMALVDVFQYLMGNTDWSVYGLHNIVIVNADLSYYAIPYDFDWTGMVNARYAKPDPRLDIRNVRTRMFRGFCRPPQDFARTFARFNEKRDEIYRLYSSLPGLADNRREDAIEYLDEFYDTINDEGRARRRIINECRR